MSKYAAPAVGPQVGLHQHHRRLRQHRRGPDRAGHQELGRRRAYLPMNAEHQPRDRAGPGAERREDEGGDDGHRLRPAAARPAFSAQIGPDVRLHEQWAPVESKTKATKRLQADLKKYADFTGVPDFGIYTGYIDCDLAIIGLKQQGKNLDPSTFADGIRKLGKTTRPASAASRSTSATCPSASRLPRAAPMRCRSRTASSSS